MAKLRSDDWNRLLREARRTKLLAHLGALMDQDLRACIPEVALECMDTHRIYVDQLQLLARADMNRLSAIVENVDYPVVLLKGVAYLALDLPNSRGRRQNDVDLLVHPNNLDDLEARLTADGWSYAETLSEYDDNYYRQWSHQLPPMRHPRFYLELDVHHALTQSTSRIQVPTAALLEEIQPIPGTPFYALSPRDLVLHSVSHLLISDEMRGGLKDLQDIRLMCEHYQSLDASFMDRLAERSETLGLSKQLDYGLSTAQQLLGLEVSDRTRQQLGGASSSQMGSVVTRLVRAEISAPDPNRAQRWFTGTCVLIRSYWIRMRMSVLIFHLYNKSVGWLRKKA